MPEILELQSSYNLWISHELKWNVLDDLGDASRQ